MPSEPDPRPWEQLEQIAKAGDVPQLHNYLNSLPPMEVVRALSRLGAEHQSRLLTMLAPREAAALLQECPESEARTLLGQLPREDAAAILLEMASDEQADLITALSAEDAEAILQEMPPEQAAEARQLASYKPDEAGGLMVKEYLSYPETLSAGEAMEDMRRNAERYAEFDVQYAYCRSPFGDLVGVLRLRDLLLTQRDKPISDIMIRTPVAVSVHASLDELEDLFGRYQFLGVPVIDSGARLIGVVRRRDVESALVGRAQSDFLKSFGIVGGEELRTMPMMVRSKRRMTWLTVNILLNIMAASVIAFYEETLSQVIALAVFLPIISDMSGNAGIQAMAVSMRELSLGLIKPIEVGRVWMKEVSLGMLNGIVLGMLLAIVALIWKGNAYLGLVVGGAMCLNTLIAVSAGGVLPLILKLLKRDPALASGPILTTITDMCGFYFVLSFATIALPYLKFE